MTSFVLPSWYGIDPCEAVEEQPRTAHIFSGLPWPMRKVDNAVLLPKLTLSEHYTKVGKER